MFGLTGRLATLDLSRTHSLALADVRPTSALDMETGRAIQSALAELSRGRTTPVVARRLATIRNADRISSNPGIYRTTSDADRHAFLESGFELIASFFEASLEELRR